MPRDYLVFSTDFSSDELEGDKDQARSSPG